MPVTVKITVPPDLQRALGADMKKVIRKASEPLAAELKATIAEYPPATEANLPNHRWYERGYGPRWSRKGGGMGGRKTSEMLNRSWGIARKKWGAIVGSRASYSPVVHSHKEQARFHKARGWVTDKMAVDKLLKSGKVDKAVRAAAAWVLKGRG